MQTNPEVLVLSGGISGEREVSLRSGRAVVQALQTLGFGVIEADPQDGLAAWMQQAQQADVVFPALHGVGGEDGQIQAELDKIGVPYVGSGVVSSQLCFNKWQFKQFILQHNLPAPTAALVDRTSFLQSSLSKSPFVLKPCEGGSSIDTFIVRDPHNMTKKDIDDAFDRYGSLLLESLIAGHEITIAILGTSALPVIEIIPPAAEEFDYENKYNGKTQEICPPQHISSEIQTRAQELALRIHELAGCRDLSRTDIMIDDQGELFVLETNTIPGLTETSLLPKAARTAGKEMPELVRELVMMTLKHR